MTSFTTAMLTRTTEDLCIGTSAPYISQNGNTITLTPQNCEHSEVLVRMTPVSTMVPTEFIYTAPFNITEDTYISAYNLRAGYKLGDDASGKLFEYEVDYSTVPFFIKNNSSTVDATLYIGYMVTVDGRQQLSSTDARPFNWSYSLDNVNWTTRTNRYYDSTTIPANGRLYLKYSGEGTWYSNMQSYYRRFTYTGGSEGCDVGGSINTLVGSWSDFNNPDLTLDQPYGSFRLLLNKMPIVSAENLSLPSQSFNRFNYAYLFSECTTLVNAPKTLPAMIVPNGLYNYMFYGCTNLLTSPDIKCVNYLSSASCNNMFKNCSKLNSIKFMSKNITMQNVKCTDSWVSGVAASGTFTKNAEATWSDVGIDGVPSGWTVQTVPNDAPYYYKSVGDVSEIVDGSKILICTNVVNSQGDEVSNTKFQILNPVFSGSTDITPYYEAPTLTINASVTTTIYTYGKLYVDQTANYEDYALTVSVDGNGYCTLANKNGDLLSYDSVNGNFGLNITGKDKWEIGVFDYSIRIRNVYDNTKYIGFDGSTRLYKIVDEAEATQLLHTWVYPFIKFH